MSTNLLKANEIKKFSINSQSISNLSELDFVWKVIYNNVTIATSENINGFDTEKLNSFVPVNKDCDISFKLSGNYIVQSIISQNNCKYTSYTYVTVEDSIISEYFVTELGDVNCVILNNEFVIMKSGTYGGNNELISGVKWEVVGGIITNAGNSSSSNITADNGVSIAKIKFNNYSISEYYIKSTPYYINGNYTFYGETEITQLYPLPNSLNISVNYTNIPNQISKTDLTINPTVTINNLKKLKNGTTIQIFYTDQSGTNILFNEITKSETTPDIYSFTKNITFPSYVTNYSNIFLNFNITYKSSESCYVSKVSSFNINLLSCCDIIPFNSITTTTGSCANVFDYNNLSIESNTYNNYTSNCIDASNSYIYLGYCSNCATSYYLKTDSTDQPNMKRYFKIELF